ncbi:SDR family oxidoreductase [Rhodococcus sp. NPDC003322]
MDRLQEKVALVTGGASGIGAATCRAFVREGAQVLIADVADGAGRALAEDLGPSATFVHLDVTDDVQWRDVVHVARERFGRLNILVNAAGILRAAPLDAYDRAAWDLTIAINLTGPFIGMSVAVELLEQSRPSSVVNISSYAGIRGVAGQPAYTASKFGLTGLTKSAAIELADRGVRVNSVHPGGVRTPMIAAALEAAAEFLDGATSTLIRPAEPDEISSLITYLASDESSYSTGAEFVVDGGMSAGMSPASPV